MHDVHRTLIRRNENIRRRAGPDLPRERARRAEVEDDRLRIPARHFLERIGETGGREDADVLATSSPSEEQAGEEHRWGQTFTFHFLYRLFRKSRRMVTFKQDFA